MFLKIGYRRNTNLRGEIFADSAEPNLDTKKLRLVESKHGGNLLEFANNYGNNHQYLVSTVVHLVINPLFLGNKIQKPGNDFSTLQAARCLKNTLSLFC